MWKLDICLTQFKWFFMHRICQHDENQRKERRVQLRSGASRDNNWEKTSGRIVSRWAARNTVGQRSSKEQKGPSWSTWSEAARPSGHTNTRNVTSTRDLATVHEQSCGRSPDNERCGRTIEGNSTRTRQRKRGPQANGCQKHWHRIVFIVVGDPSSTVTPPRPRVFALLTCLFIFLR